MYDMFIGFSSLIYVPQKQEHIFKHFEEIKLELEKFKK